MHNVSNGRKEKGQENNNATNVLDLHIFDIFQFDNNDIVSVGWALYCKEAVKLHEAQFKNCFDLIDIYFLLPN